ncbi:MAG: DUF3293 domain-containing protein [Planctomycetota bacterium]|nr:DUF3293 domain-containing protein [Planctomycetota bacterium]MEE3367373.1 DUF3293 domain-containing protein [Planctomycetota bacterium]
MTRAELLKAYRATTYRADIDGRTVDLRIGSPVADPDLASQAWAFISAANPGSRPLPSSENLDRHQDLLEICRESRWIAYPGQGIPESDDWEAEISLLVTGIGREEAVAIGRDFGQVAIVYGEIGSVAELVVIDGSDARSN